MAKQKEKKKILIVLNPCAGTKQANKHLAEIIEIFCKAGHDVSVKTTAKRGDGQSYVAQNGKDYDIIVPIGGDGTFNEVVAGIRDGKIKKDIGYIPAGSTNDYANSVGLPKKLLTAARNVLKGKVIQCDMGEFNGRPFTYIASFGIFTQASCNTNQKMKNDFGFLAYVIGSLKEIKNIKGEHLKITANGKTWEDDYIFGAIVNSTSFAGLFKIKGKDVDLGDGKFEVILVKKPKDPAQFGKTLMAVTSAKYGQYPGEIEFFKASQLELVANSKMPWTLDGEFQKGAQNITIKNIKKAISIIVPEKGKKTKKV